MRLRHRHFNPAHADATMAFDARYGFSQADGTSVSSWPDRSRTAISATQANGANQPTYETNEINGQPVVSFDGSNDSMGHGQDNAASCVWVVVAKVRSTQSGFRGFAAAGASGSSAGTMILSRVSTAGTWGTFSSAENAAITTPANGTAYIFTMVDNGANGGAFFLSGAADGTYAGDSIGQATKHIGGIGGQNTASDIAVVTLMPAVNTALRKRLEHASAYSFKLSCN
jgi:hypothetical protein